MFANTPFVINVGSHTADGIPVDYSEPCATIVSFFILLLKATNNALKNGCSWFLLLVEIRNIGCQQQPQIQGKVVHRNQEDNMQQHRQVFIFIRK